MSDVLPTDKQKQERWGGRRWVAQRLGAGRATDAFAVQTCTNLSSVKKVNISRHSEGMLTKLGIKDFWISKKCCFFLPWMWMWDKASLLLLTVWPSPFIFLLLLLNAEACKDTKKTLKIKNISVAFIYQHWSVRQIHVMRFPVLTLFEITASVPSPLSETAEVFLPETLEPKAVFWTLWGLPFRLQLVFARENSSEAAKESQFLEWWCCMIQDNLLVHTMYCFVLSTQY